MSEFLSPSEVAECIAEIRPWHHSGYGTDGRATGVVDWYDGWHVGSCADDNEMKVPRACNDRIQWIAGWQEGWHDGAISRQWRKTHVRSSQAVSSRG